MSGLRYPSHGRSRQDGLSNAHNADVEHDHTVRVSPLLTAYHQLACTLYIYMCIASSNIVFVSSSSSLAG